MFVSAPKDLVKELFFFFFFVRYEVFPPLLSFIFAPRGKRASTFPPGVFYFCLA